MKPCSNNRKLIAWLALNALEARQERELRSHLEACEGCRRYLEEISNVTEKLAASEIRSDIQTSESFHQKVSSRLRAETSVSATVVAYLRAYLWKWRNKKERLLTPSLSPRPTRGEGVRLVRRSFSEGGRTGEGMFMGRLALPVIGATVLVIAALSLFVRRPGVPLPAPTAARAVSIQAEKSDLDPTLSNYQMIANRSLEKLDELLTKQGNRNPSPALIYTASALSRANALD